MFTLIYCPLIGESAPVSAVDWEKRNFHYNDPQGLEYHFTASEIEKFAAMFGTSFQVIQLD